MPSARRISDVVTSRPSVRAVARASPVSNTEAGLPTLAMIANRRKTGYNFAQEFEFLANSIRYLVRQTGDVGSCDIRDQAGPDRVRHRREHDRNDRCRLLCREGWRGCHRDNDIDLEPDELGRDFCVTLIAALCPTILNREVATVDPSEFAKPLNKSGNPLALNRRVGTQESDGRQFARLLRAPPTVTRSPHRGAA
jgi:hypothetical protein